MGLYPTYVVTSTRGPLFPCLDRGCLSLGTTGKVCRPCSATARRRSGCGSTCYAPFPSSGEVDGQPRQGLAIVVVVRVEQLVEAFGCGLPDHRQCLAFN